PFIRTLVVATVVVAALVVAAFIVAALGVRALIAAALVAARVIGTLGVAGCAPRDDRAEDRAHGRAGSVADRRPDPAADQHSGDGIAGECGGGERTGHGGGRSADQQGCLRPLE